jgi:branched-chain amino acid aminotransferase
VFLTSSLRDIQGVERWDDRVLPAARPITEELALLLLARSSTDLEP